MTAALILAAAAATLVAVGTFLETIEADAGAMLCHHAASAAVGGAAALYLFC